MQFRLLAIFASIGLATLVLATLTAPTWQLSLIWLVVMAVISLTVLSVRSYRRRSIFEFIEGNIYRCLTMAPAGVVGVVVGFIIFNYTGWFPGFSQWFFAGAASNLAIGMRWPRFVWQLMGG